jgi:preprotein translocase subunit SecY
MLSAFANIWKVPELKKRVLFTLGVVALVRVGCNIPVPGIDTQLIQANIAHRATQDDILQWFNLFTGGALQQCAIFSLGIMPYITASIIMQLLTAVIPALKRMIQEGESGRQAFIQYTRYLTVAICFGQAAFFAGAIANNPAALLGGRPEDWAGLLVIDRWQFIALTVATLTCGTVFLMWLGEQITERGIGNGASMIITIGIIDRLPHAAVLVVQQFFTGGQTGSTQNPFLLLPMVAMLLVAIGFVVALTQGQRRIPVQYTKRMVGRKMLGGGTTYMPLRINYAGVMPIIFGQALLIFPIKILSLVNVPWLSILTNALQPGHLVYEMTYGLLILFFAYFWVATQFDPIQISDDLKKHGGYIPGIRPGQPTADFLDHVMTRITLAGAIALTIIAIVPDWIGRLYGLPRMIYSFFGGTSLLIVVGVMLDTMRQVESHLLMRHYDGFLKKGKIRGRR